MVPFSKLKRGDRRGDIEALILKSPFSSSPHHFSKLLPADVYSPLNTSVSVEVAAMCQRWALGLLLIRRPDRNASLSGTGVEHWLVYSLRCRGAFVGGGGSPAAPVE